MWILIKQLRKWMYPSFTKNQSGWSTIAPFVFLSRAKWETRPGRCPFPLFSVCFLFALQPASPNFFLPLIILLFISPFSFSFYPFLPSFFPSPPCSISLFLPTCFQTNVCWQIKTSNIENFILVSLIMTQWVGEGEATGDRMLLWVVYSSVYTRTSTKHILRGL